MWGQLQNVLTYVCETQCQPRQGNPAAFYKLLSFPLWVLPVTLEGLFVIGHRPPFKIAVGISGSYQPEKDLQPEIPLGFPIMVYVLGCVWEMRRDFYSVSYPNP